MNANVRPRIAVPVGNTMVDLPMHGPLGAPTRSRLAAPEPEHPCTGQYAADDSRSGGAGILHLVGLAFEPKQVELNALLWGLGSCLRSVTKAKNRPSRITAFSLFIARLVIDY